MKATILGLLLSLVLACPANAASYVMRTFKAIDEPIYYVVNVGCFLVNWPISSAMWVNKHVRTHLVDAADKEEKAEAAEAKPASK